VPAAGGVGRPGKPVVYGTNHTKGQYKYWSFLLMKLVFSMMKKPLALAKIKIKSLANGIMNKRWG